jgi:hypothetical protein
MRSTAFAVGIVVISMSMPSAAQEPKAQPSPSATASPKDAVRPEKAPGSKEAKAVKCEAHGVAKNLCARCNPKLAAVFKAKGDWCQEHDRPESQCVICHPELEKKGIK